MMNHLLTQARQLEFSLRSAYMDRVHTKPALAVVLLEQSIAANHIANTLEQWAKDEPAAESQYRMLEAGEIIQESDEYNSAFLGRWRPVGASIGITVGRSSSRRFRRPVVTAANFQPVVDFHQRECGGGEK